MGEELSKTHSEELIKLEKRISNLENKINEGHDNAKDIKKSPSIKEVTFRIGTEDDRLRIYWSDGRKTDLPCTKDQNIWVCG